MKEKDIYETWGKFKIDYKKFFPTDKEIWVVTSSTKP